MSAIPPPRQITITIYKNYYLMLFIKDISNNTTITSISKTASGNETFCLAILQNMPITKLPIAAKHNKIIIMTHKKNISIFS